ncbi:MAG: tetratricopeptide repeat protein [Candidatus Margulisiibacteriota bacterium]
MKNKIVSIHSTPTTPKAPVTPFALAKLLFRCGLYAAALHFINKQIRAQENASSYCFRARIYAAMGKTEKAINDVETSFRFLVTPEAYNFLGELYLDMGNLEEASKSFERAIDLASGIKHPMLGNYYLSLGKALISQKKHLLAEPIINHALLQTDITNKSLRAAVFVEFGLINSHAEIRPLCFNKALKLSPNCAAAHIELGRYTLLSEGDISKALMHFNKAFTDRAFVTAYFKRSLSFIAKMRTISPEVKDQIVFLRFCKKTPETLLELVKLEEKLSNG